MRISVNASRRDEILEEQARYNEEMKKHNDTYNQQYSRYEMAEDYNHAEVENAIREQIPGLSELGVQITVETWYRDTRVEFDASRGAKSLQWRWTVRLDREGNITKDSSSWSGASITTPEEIADLRKSVDILSALINLDWKSILEQGRANKPKLSDYVSLREMKDRSYEFAKELKVAAIEEIIGQEKWIKGGTFDGSRWNYGDKWYMIHSQTEKFYTVSIMSGYTVDSYKEGIAEGTEGYTQEKLEENLEWNSRNTERVKKEKLLPCIKDTIEIMDMQGNITVENPPQSEDTEASTDISSNLVTL